MFFFEFYESLNLAEKIHAEEWSPGIDQVLMITVQLGIDFFTLGVFNLFLSLKFLFSYILHDFLICSIYFIDEALVYYWFDCVSLTYLRITYVCAIAWKKLVIIL